jgi:high-affinity nickel-transport protein
MAVDTAVSTFIAASIPAMILLGFRHALDADHITAIDNLVRMHNASKKSRWVGAGFSTGHMTAVLAEMVFIILMVGSLAGADDITFWGGVIGATALATIGAVNIYAMKKWGRTGSAILASKVVAKTGTYNPFVSSFITGTVFGLGFDTATQISALTLSAVASATLSIQVAFALAGFFALGIISLDTLDSILLRSAFSKMLNSKGFRYMSYALSGAAMMVAGVATYENLTKAEVMPELAGPILFGGIVAAAFGYAYVTRGKAADKITTTKTITYDSDKHDGKINET